MPQVLGNCNAAVTYMRTERALPLIHTASRPLHGKARTASHPWTYPAPGLRRWRAEPPFCRRKWPWSTRVSPELSPLREHTRSLTIRPCKKWLSSVGLAWWEMAFVRVTFKNKTCGSVEKRLPLDCIYYRRQMDRSQLKRQVKHWRRLWPGEVSIRCRGEGFFCFYFSLIWNLWTNNL